MQIGSSSLDLTQAVSLSVSPSEGDRVSFCQETTFSLVTSVPSSCTPRVCLPKRTQFVLLFLFFGHLQKQNFRSKRKKYKIQNRRFMPRGCKSPAVALFPVLPSPGEASSVRLRLKIPPSTFRSRTHFLPTST